MSDLRLAREELLGRRIHEHADGPRIGRRFEALAEPASTI